MTAVTTSSSPPRDASLYDTFVQLFAEHHNRLLGFILAFVHDRDAAQEIFQEMSLILWRKFDQYDPEGDFVRWANAISFNQIRRYRRERMRDKLIFSEPLFEKLADDYERLRRDVDRRAVALSWCITRLRDIDRRLVQAYYGDGMTAQRAAERLGRSIFAIRKALKRVRRTLLACIEQRLAAGDHNP